MTVPKRRVRLLQGSHSCSTFDWPLGHECWLTSFLMLLPYVCTRLYGLVFRFEVGPTPGAPQLWVNLLSEHELNSGTFYCDWIPTNSYSERFMCSCLVCIGSNLGRRLKYSVINTLRTRFQRLIVDISRAVASSCKIKLQHFANSVQFVTYPQGMPNAREWIRNHMEDVHTFPEERYVIVGYISMTKLVTATR